jgi:hypothetical protein
MDNKKILLINLSKGLVGDTNMRLLGSMLTTRIFLGAMSRANLPPHEQAKAEPFYFYVDEFQNFANESFSEILSEARKYNLNLTIAHQYVAQMEEEVQAAVFGNVGTTISFRVGPLDAELLEKVFTPEFLQEDLVNLGFAQVYLSLMIDGIGSRPFSAVTIPGIEAPSRSYRTEVIAASRAQFASARSGVETQIFDELMLTENEEKAAAEIAKSQRDAKRAVEKSEESYTPRPQSSERAAPRREDRPQAPRSDRPQPKHEDRPERTEKRPERPPAPSAGRTADDLKAILRATVANGDKDKQKKEAGKQDSLKEALRTTMKDVPVAPKQAPSMPKPQVEPRPAPSPVSERAPEPEGPTKAVFEVPEETLRSLFKDV